MRKRRVTALAPIPPIDVSMPEALVQMRTGQRTTRTWQATFYGLFPYTLSGHHLVVAVVVLQGRPRGDWAYLMSDGAQTALIAFLRGDTVQSVVLAHPVRNHWFWTTLKAMIEMTVLSHQPRHD